MSNTAIKVENLGKLYHLGLRHEQFPTLRHALVSGIKRIASKQSIEKNNENTIWALKDVSFDIQHGEVVGIVGRNGAGKSTLLKLLAHITEPTEGRISLYGRVGSLLEVGTGFHPELTGRDNIYLNGAILGMKRTEIKRKFDEIVDFADIDKFLDTPVKHYSSGMYVRLAFAVAASLEPEILVVDEVLAVGDAEFQKKCLGKMGDVAKGGRTVLFVSHSMGTISALCPKSIYIERGIIKDIGLTPTVIGHYLEDANQNLQTPLSQRVDRAGNGQIRIKNIEFLSEKTFKPLESIISGQSIYIKVEFDTRNISSISGFNLGLAFFTRTGQFVMVLNSQMASRAFETLPLVGKVYCFVPKFPLMTGFFHVKATLQLGSVLVDQVDNAAVIHVEEGDFFGTGIPNAYGRQGVYVSHEWMQALPILDKEDAQ